MAVRLMQERMFVQPSGTRVILRLLRGLSYDDPSSESFWHAERWLDSVDETYKRLPQQFWGNWWNGPPQRAFDEWVRFEMKIGSSVA